MGFNRPSDFSTSIDVDIDAYDILDYVKENQAWFEEKCGFSHKENFADIANEIQHILDNYDNIRRYRDAHPGNDEIHVRLYNDLVYVFNRINQWAEK